MTVWWISHRDLPLGLVTFSDLFWWAGRAPALNSMMHSRTILGNQSRITSRCIRSHYSWLTTNFWRPKFSLISLISDLGRILKLKNEGRKRGGFARFWPCYHHHQHLQITSFIDENYEWVQPFLHIFLLINICLFSGESLNLLTPTSIHNLIGKHGKLELSLSVSNIFTSVSVFDAGENHFLCWTHRDTSWSKRDIRVSRQDRNYCSPLSRR